MISQSFAFCTFDLFELIDFGVFAVIRTTDSVGKKRLKIRIGRRRIIFACGGHVGMAGEMKGVSRMFQITVE